jgi:hypothetical protein
MLSGGLGWTDFRQIDAFGGYARSAIEALAGKGGMPGNRYAFDPIVAEPYFQKLVRSHGIPVIWSKGVGEVQMRDRAITAIHTLDGRQFVGRTYIDASYEGDLLAQAGVSSYVGREAADAANPLDGYRNPFLPNEGHDDNFRAKDRKIRVDPFLSPGDPKSGLLPTINRLAEKQVGSADEGVQAYGFRLTMTRQPEMRQDLASTPPDGYRKADFELLFRYIAAVQAQGLVHGKDWTFQNELVKADEIAPGIYDVNNHGAISTDAVGLSWGYPRANYEERERIWKAHEAYTRGFFYALAWERDERLPASLQQEVRNWGLVKGHFTSPAPNDAAGWPYQLYIREARRLNNGQQWSGEDLSQPDNTPLRYGNVVAMGSYMQDSHVVQRIAAHSPEDGWVVRNEGQLAAATGGRDSRSPLPFELMVPHENQCTNLLTSFCVASSHQAFSCIRMELTSMALGEAAGTAAAMAVTPPTTTHFQNIDHKTLQSLLQGNGGVLTEVPALTEDWRLVKTRAMHLL